MIKENPWNLDILGQAKRMGFADITIAKYWGSTELEVYNFRKEKSIMPVYKMVDTCSAEFESKTPYYYGTYETFNESKRTDKPSVVVLGSGPIRIGQGVEFDYATVHCVMAIQQAGYEAIIINNNPETVSTDFSISDKLYFEPLTIEDVMHVIDLEQPEGVIVQFGGQTAINLASKLQKKDVIVLTGELGSGKTKFVEGILSYFNLEDEISSPTFTIVNEYKTTKFPIFHFDVYRLSDVSEFYEIGGEEYFENGICLIEWGELISDALPSDFIHITFEKDSKNEDLRILNIQTYGNKFNSYFDEH